MRPTNTRSPGEIRAALAARWDTTASMVVVPMKGRFFKSKSGRERV